MGSTPMTTSETEPISLQYFLLVQDEHISWLVLYDMFLFGSLSWDYVFKYFIHFQWISSITYKGKLIISLPSDLLEFEREVLNCMDSQQGKIDLS